MRDEPVPKQLGGRVFLAGELADLRDIARDVLSNRADQKLAAERRGAKPSTYVRSEIMSVWIDALLARGLLDDAGYDDKPKLLMVDDPGFPWANIEARDLPAFGHRIAWLSQNREARAIAAFSLMADDTPIVVLSPAKRDRLVPAPVLPVYEETPSTRPRRVSMRFEASPYGAPALAFIYGVEYDRHAKGWIARERLYGRLLPDGRGMSSTRQYSLIGISGLGDGIHGRHPDVWATALENPAQIALYFGAHRARAVCAFPSIPDAALLRAADKPHLYNFVVHHHTESGVIPFRWWDLFGWGMHPLLRIAIVLAEHNRVGGWRIMVTNEDLPDAMALAENDETAEDERDARAARQRMLYGGE